MNIKILLQALNSTWFIEPTAANNYALVLHQLITGQRSSFFNDDEQPKEFAWAISENSTRIGSLSDALDNGIAVITLRGAVMKYDYCGAAGTQSLMVALQQANDNPSITAIILQIDSPGGSVDGTQQFANAIKNSGKPVVAYIDGMMCSAAMWIGSAASTRIASANTDTIGSIGTMAAWYDYKKAYEQEVITLHEVYASASTQKNLEFREANKGNYEPMITTWLDPTNEEFMNDIQGNLGIETERGSTAVIRIFQQIAREPEKFATVAGKSVQEFTDLVNKDMVAAFLEVAKGAQTAGSSNVLFGQILKDLDADGSGTGEVLSKLGTNYELVGDKVKLMTDALKDGSSITQEFNTKNTGLGAELDKLSKAFNSLLASRALNDILTSLVGTAASLLTVIRAIPQWLKENQIGIYLLAAGVATLNASYIKAGALIIRDTALKITNATATKTTAIATNIAIAAQAAWIVITDLLTGKIKLAIAAQRLWNITISLGAGPIGIILIAVGALVAGITSLYNATHKLTAAQQLQQDIQKKVVEATSNQVSKIEILKSVIADTNVSLDNRKKALEELIRINPKYLEGLTLENFNTEQGKKLVDGYIDSLKRKAEVEAKASLLQDKIKQRDSAIVELRSKIDFGKFTTEDFEKYVANAAATAEKNSVFGFALDAKIGGVNLTELNDVLKQIAILRTDITATAKKDIETVVTTGTVTTQTTTTIATIREQIQQLDKDVENIDAKNTKAITENRTKRKAFQDQLEKLLGENKTSQKAQKDATQAANAWDNLISKINDNLAKLTKDPYHYELDKIFQDRIEQLKEIDKLGKEAGKSQTEINAVKFKVEVSSLASVQKLISETKLPAPKPIEIPIVTGVNPSRRSSTRNSKRQNKKTPRRQPTRPHCKGRT